MKLKHNYSLYFTGNEFKKNMTKEDFEKQLEEVTSFDNYNDFWELFLHLKLPTELQANQKIFIFKNKIKPTWEHPEN